MKKIVVVSDSHYNNELLDKIHKDNLDANLYLHAGDSEDFESNIYPYVSVKGNNDYYIDDLFKILEIDNHRIYLTHGHKMYLTDENLLRKARENNCDIIIFGHTHRPYYKLVDNIHIINPGALSYSRSQVGETYAIIELLDDNSIDVRHITI